MPKKTVVSICNAIDNTSLTYDIMLKTYTDFLSNSGESFLAELLDP